MRNCMNCRWTSCDEYGSDTEACDIYDCDIDDEFDKAHEKAIRKQFEKDCT